MPSRLAFALCAVVALALAGCGLPDVDYGRYDIKCGPEAGGCPAGYTCGDEKRCVPSDGSGPGGGGEGEGEGEAPGTCQGLCAEIRRECGDTIGSACDVACGYLGAAAHRCIRAEYEANGCDGDFSKCRGGGV